MSASTVQQQQGGEGMSGVWLREDEWPPSMRLPDPLVPESEVAKRTAAVLLDYRHAVVAALTAAGFGQRWAEELALAASATAKRTAEARR